MLSAEDLANSRRTGGGICFAHHDFLRRTAKRRPALRFPTIHQIDDLLKARRAYVIAPGK